MSTPSASGFLIRYPEFSATLEATIEARLADALLEMRADIWGVLYERGAYALTAHILTLDTLSSSDTGAVSVRTVGDVSISYGAYLSLNPNDYSFNDSKYGREYRRLMRLVSSGPVVV